MSGGSFNYLCQRDAEEISSYLSDMEDMANELQALGQIELEAETRAIMDEYTLFFTTMQARIDVISPVWRAVEWACSGDTGIEAVLRAAAAWTAAWTAAAGGGGGVAV